MSICRTSSKKTLPPAELSPCQPVTEEEAAGEWQVPEVRGRWNRHGLRITSSCSIHDSSWLLSRSAGSSGVDWYVERMPFALQWTRIFSEV